MAAGGGILNGSEQIVIVIAIAQWYSGHSTGPTFCCMTSPATRFEVRFQLYVSNDSMERWHRHPDARVPATWVSRARAAVVRIGRRRGRRYG